MLHGSVTFERHVDLHSSPIQSTNSSFFPQIIVERECNTVADPSVTFQLTFFFG